VGVCIRVQATEVQFKHKCVALRRGQDWAIREGQHAVDSTCGCAYYLMEHLL
jgi:hypothetical protein